MNNYKEWISRAESNLLVAQTAQKGGGLFYEDLCNQLHQAVEKALKGLLVFYDEDPPKTHDLFNLLSRLERYINVTDDILDKTLLLDRYSVNIRYPGSYDPVTLEEFEEAFVVAMNYIHWVKNQIYCDL